MSNLTPELNLSTAVDDDDTADYLTIALADSLTVLDGMFNSVTGHAHNGSHQGGALEFLDLTVGEDLTVMGGLNVKSGTSLESTLHVTGATTLDSSLAVGTNLTVNGTSHLVGAVTIDGAINSSGTLTISQGLAVGTDLSVGGNASIVGTLTAGAITTGGGGLTILGPGTFAGVIRAPRAVIGGYDPGWAFSVSGDQGGGASNPITQGFWYQRGNGGIRCWDNADFTFGVGIAANTVVQRDSGGGIQVNGVYMPVAGVGGRPPYVLGQSGDGQAHWYNSSTIGPPTAAVAVSVGFDLNSGDGTAMPQVSTVAPDRTGYWWVSIKGDGRNPGSESPNLFRVDVDGIGTVISGQVEGEGSGAGQANYGGLAGPFLIGPANIIRTFARRSWGYMNGTTYGLFIPVQGYPN